MADTKIDETDLDRDLIIKAARVFPIEDLAAALDPGHSRRSRRKRKPNLAAALKQASKAGYDVNGVTVAPDGGISLRFGTTAAEHTNGHDDPLPDETPDDLRKLI